MVTFCIYHILRRKIYTDSIKSYKEGLILCQEKIRNELRGLLVDIGCYKEDMQTIDKNYAILTNKITNLEGSLNCSVENLTKYSKELNNIVLEMEKLIKSNDLSNLTPVINITCNKEWSLKIDKTISMINAFRTEYLVYHVEENKNQYSNHMLYLENFADNKKEIIKDFVEENKELFNINKKYQESLQKDLLELAYSTETILNNWFNI